MQAPQLQKFLKIFGQNVDAVGKSTREKTFEKVVKGQTCSLHSLTFALSSGSYGSNAVRTQVFCFEKAIYRTWNLHFSLNKCEVMQ